MTIDLVQLAGRIILLLMPLSVAILAFRRLVMSQSVNAWLYGATGLLSAFTLVALLPWAIAGTPIRLMPVLIALGLPPAWMGILVLCGNGTGRAYAFPDAPGLAPLVLRDPEPEVPVFRHSATHLAPPAKKPEDHGPSADALAAARTMRSNPSSDARRASGPPKSPPPKAGDLPFLRS